MDFHSLLTLLLQFSAHLPLLLIYCVGFVLAATRLAQQRRFAWLCMAGFGCHVVGLLASAGSHLWLTYATQTGSLATTGTASIHAVFGLVQLIVMLIACCGWVLLLIALFSGRRNSDS